MSPHHVQWEAVATDRILKIKQRALTPGDDDQTMFQVIEPQPSQRDSVMALVEQWHAGQ